MAEKNVESIDAICRRIASEKSTTLSNCNFYFHAVFGEIYCKGTPEFALVAGQANDIVPKFKSAPFNPCDKNDEARYGWGLVANPHGHVFIVRSGGLSTKGMPTQ